MKKSLIIIVAGLIGLALPIAGMTITPTRNLILGLAPNEAILALADKIDEESGMNNEQQQIIENLQRSENERIDLEEKKKIQDEESRIKAEADRARREIENKISNCENRKQSCIETIAREKSNAEEQEKNYKRAKKNLQDSSYEDLIVDSKKKTLDEANESLKKATENCAGYDKPCE